jgi:hypothetical protein
MQFLILFAEFTQLIDRIESSDCVQILLFCYFVVVVEVYHGDELTDFERSPLRELIDKSPL